MPNGLSSFVVERKRKKERKREWERKRREERRGKEKRRKENPITSLQY